MLTIDRSIICCRKRNAGGNHGSFGSDRENSSTKEYQDMEHAVANLKDSEFGSQENYPQLNNYSNKYWFRIKEVRQIYFCIS